MMRIGFIGAGKVGYTLGRYFTEQGSFLFDRTFLSNKKALRACTSASTRQESCASQESGLRNVQKHTFLYVTGYCSHTMRSAEDAAEFTGSKSYSQMEQLVADSDVVFFTVPDEAIAEVWEQVKTFPIQGKIICHCSGALSSAVFSEIGQMGASGYSIHPFFAVSDRYNSYKELSKALFTIEGTNDRLEEMTGLLRQCGLTVQQIQAAGKVRYHAAAAVASNLVVGIVELAEELLVSCGFSQENALYALKPLMEGNLSRIMEAGTAEALTGPLERADSGTVQKHLQALEGEDREIYRLLSQKILGVAKSKNPNRDYMEMERILQ